MKKELASRADIELLINSFYDDVRKDTLLGPVFNKIIGDDWSHHLPVMYQFWDMVLFATPGYAGNPTRKHVDIDRRMRLSKEHFDRWLALWYATVDRLFEGEKADEVKQRATMMANLISIKIDSSREGHFIQ